MTVVSDRIQSSLECADILSELCNKVFELSLSNLNATDECSILAIDSVEPTSNPMRVFDLIQQKTSQPKLGLTPVYENLEEFLSFQLEGEQVIHQETFTQDSWFSSETRVVVLSSTRLWVINPTRYVVVYQQSINDQVSFVHESATSF